MVVVVAMVVVVVAVVFMVVVVVVVCFMMPVCAIFSGFSDRPTETPLENRTTSTPFRFVSSFTFFI